MIDLPARAQSRIRRIVRRRASGSMPDSGSSRISSAGSCTIACASLTRWRMPLLYAPIFLPAASIRSTIVSARRAASSAAFSSRPLSRTSAVTHSRPGHPLVERVLFRAEADLEVELRIAPDRLAEHRHDALARLQLTGDQLHERRLARAVRAEQARHAGRDVDADVVEADDLPVPLGDVLGGHDRRAHAGRAHVTTSTPRTRRSRIEIDTTISPTMTMSDTCHGVMYRGGTRKMTSMTCARLVTGDIHENAELPVISVEHLIDRGGEEDDAGVENRRRSGCSSRATTAPAS